MSCSSKKKHKNFVQIFICPTKISNKTEKKYKEKKLKEITNAFNGLVNTNGGVLELRYEKSPPKEHVNECIRRIEQKIIESTGVIDIALNVEMNTSCPSQVSLSVVGPTCTRYLSTLNYHLYLPSDRQVIEVPPSEPVEKIKRIIDAVTSFVEPTSLGSHAKHFIQCQKVNFSESKRCQFKNLKAQKTKNVSLSDRIKANKLPCYISAYANYGGGHIYYGIKDDGTVEGEKITKNDQDKIETTVSNTMDKMKWPEHCDQSEPKRGKRWEIHFEPVLDSKGKPIPSIFVIVIYIAQCPGGVFTEEPECYHIVDGLVKKMHFNDWKLRISDPDFETTQRGDIIGSKDGSSYCSVYPILTKLLNNNCSWSVLKQASTEAEDSNKEIDVKLISLSKLISFCFRKGEYSKAEDLLKDYKNLLLVSKSPNTAVFEVMEQYLHCVMERSREKYTESYRIAKSCLEKANDIPVGLFSAAFYVLVATVTNILAVQERDPKKKSFLIKEATTFYEKTKCHLENVHGFPSAKADIEQKMYTNLALLNLGSSLTGDITHDYEDFGNMKTAEDCLEKTQQIVTRYKYPLSDFREIQYNFALSCLYYRSSCQESQHRQIELLYDALKYSKKAEKLAINCELVEMIRYSKKRIHFLQDELPSW